jgi:hypothetical protein
MKKISLLGILILVLLINLISVTAITNISEDYTDYFWNGTTYMTDGIGSDDVALDGVHAINTESLDGHGWQKSTGNPLYSNAYALRGNVSGAIVGTSWGVFFDQWDLANSYKINGTLGLSVYVPTGFNQELNMFIEDKDGNSCSFRLHGGNWKADDPGVCQGYGVGAHPVKFDTWTPILFNFSDSETIQAYVNGSLALNTTKIGYDGIRRFAFLLQSSGTVYIDRIWMANASGPPPFGPPPSPPTELTTTLISPPNPTTNNTNDLKFRFNVTITNQSDAPIDNCTLYTDETGSWEVEENMTNVDINITQTFNHSFTADGTYLWNVLCSDGDTTDWGNQNFSISIDTVSPNITINPTNTFTINNLSIDNQYLDLFQFNLTFEDDTDLFGILINVTKDGVSYFNFTNFSLSGNTVYDYINEINISSFPEGVYDINITVADSHTKNEIEDYGINQFGNKLTFNTEEGNIISIASDGAWNTFYEKTNKEENSNNKKDRYSFGFDYIFADNKRTYILESNKPIIYIGNDKFIGHFIVWDNEKRQGNWIDFENLEDGDAKVTKINDYKYEIRFDNLLVKNKVKFNSIGGLNEVEEDYQWYRGSFDNTFTTPATTGSTQTFSLNITKKDGFVENVNATFTYNESSKTVTKTEFENYIEFSSSFNLPEEESTFDLQWSVNVTQNDSSSYQFTINDTQEVFFAQITINLFDEENQTPINETGTLYLTLEQSITRTITNGTLNVGNLTLGEYFIQAETPSYPRRGVFFTVTNQTNELDLYLVKDVLGNDFIDYILFGDDQVAIEDARFTFQKSINNSYITMAQFETDFAGQGRIFQDQANEYRIIIDAPGDFDLKTINLFPLKTEYSIILETLRTSLYTNVYEGIQYKFGPSDMTLNVTQVPYNIFLDIFADDSSLEYFGVQLTNHSYTCIPASCITNISGSPAGGVATVQLIGNETGTFDVVYFFKRSGFNVQYIHGSLKQLIVFIVGERLADRLAELRANLGSELMATIFAAIMTTILVVLAAQFGVAGTALMGVATFGNMFFIAAKFINPVIGIILIIVGITVWVILAGGQESG